MKTLTIIMLVVLASTLWAGKEYDEAVNLIKEKKYGVAKTLLEATLKTDQSPKVHFALGHCLERLGKKDEAVLKYRDSVAANLTTRTDADEAGRALKKLMELKPGIGPVLSAAMDLEDLGDKEKSEFVRQAAKRLYDYALDPANWDLKPKAEPEPTVQVGPGKLFIPEGAREFGGHHYARFRITPGMTWEKAQEACRKMGGYLLCINGADEQKWIKEEAFRPKVNGEKFTGLFSIRIAYIGFYAKAGRFVWVDGTSMRYEGPWVSDVKGKAEKGSYGVIYGERWGSNLAEWRVLPGPSSAVTHYICEWEKR
jgi:tetratricopeptide (TPR) repeat protein